ncbi:MAG TPA: D-alanyl-D-alanine carboxypeptidase [Bacillota bacterium]|nr:D-alanyl-D-alanine carboxypeptidase [Clostridiaceae bacterium]HPL99066.1 D-alanyl-D-alanine carboxypeptidase [Bacillota bacterium]HPX68849.1 D-alanyl-D-alanine carboxypeptidase [Bacillota bacterium]
MSNTPKQIKAINVFSKGTIAAIIIITVVGLSILGVFRFTRPIPAAGTSKTSENIVLPGELSVTFPEQGQAAVGTDTFGVIAASPNQESIPIASVAKIMTAYLVLKAHPLQPGEEGPSLTITDEDVAGYKYAVQNNHSYLPVAAGTALTERQLLQGLMLPSGNNIADTIGRWIAGTDEAFIDKMNETAKALGMTNTHYADASGADDATVSNAADQIIMAQAAMQDPAFREIVAMPQAVLPVAGKVYNVNAMLGKHGIVGIKTGSGVIAGGNFVSAAPIENGSEKHYIIAAVLGSRKPNENLKSAFDANAQILNQVRPQFKTFTIEPPENGFGKIITPWHTESELTVNEPIQVFGYPGMKMDYSIEPLELKLPALPGTDVATLTIQTGKTTQTYMMQNKVQIEKPGFLWRLIRN